MNKTKLAICMKDLEYQTRFVSCFMNHYNHQYELHVFTSAKQMEESNSMEYAVIITGEYSTEEMTIFVERGEIILNLKEDFGNEKESLDEKLVQTEKYQEVYKIVELIQRLVADKMPGKGNSHQKSGYEMIGVHSLTQEMYQAPFVALLGKIYGEQQKVLVLDLQCYSGLSDMEEGMASMGLEDLLSVASTGNYSKSRMLECIRHESNWDYICATQNNQCLAESTQELYNTMIDILVREFGYQVIIINFGTMFFGQLDMMESCQCLYWLGGKAGELNWREKMFEYDLKRREKEHLKQVIQRVEIPTNQKREVNWRVLMEQWAWGSLGEGLRQGRKKVYSYGPVM